MNESAVEKTALFIVLLKSNYVVIKKIRSHKNEEETNVCLSRNMATGDEVNFGRKN